MNYDYNKCLEIWDEQGTLLLLENPSFFEDMEKQPKNAKHFLQTFNDCESANFAFRNYPALQEYLAQNPNYRDKWDAWIMLPNITLRCAEELLPKCSYEIAIDFFWASEERDHLYESLNKRNDLTIEDLVCLYNGDFLTYETVRDFLTNQNCPYSIRIHAAKTKPVIACIGLAKNPTLEQSVANILLSRYYFHEIRAVLEQRGFCQDFA